MKIKCMFTLKDKTSLMLKCRDIVKQITVIFSRCLFPSPCRHNKMVQNLYFLIFNLTINTLTSTLVVDLSKVSTEVNL